MTAVIPTAHERYEAQKELARRHLHEFVKQAWHVLEPEMRFFDNWHILMICQHLEAVVDGKILRLLINVPPGTMKSLLVNVFWPAWVWITHPARRFIHASYAEALSMRDSVKCRDLITSEWYQSRWPLGLKEDQNTKGKYENSKGGWRMVGSVTGKGTGEHPDVFVFDDPHNVIETESDAERQRVIDFLEGVMSTRGITRNVRRVLIMQRLHCNDASGWAIEKKNWEHICLPMRFEEPDEELQDNKPTGRFVPRMKETSIGGRDPRKIPGELLWPKLYLPSIVDNLEIELGVYKAAGQLQQRPSPKGGSKFQRAWFAILGACPTYLKILRYWDKAGTKGGTGAETAGVLMGHYINPAATLPAFRNRYIILDVIHGRWQAAEREAVIKQTAALDKAKWGYVETWVEQEPGSGGLESAQATVSNNPGYTVQIERVTGSKEVRAEPLASQASVGNVALLIGNWNQAFLEEAEMFPVGKLKDMIDAAGGAFNKLCTPTGAMSGSGDVHTGTNEMLGEKLEVDRLEIADMRV